MAFVRRAGRSPRGIVHVGANDGHEFKYYRESGAECVVYVEPLPDVFEKLKRNLKDTPGHHAVCALLADADGREVDFHVASNKGQSSSIFALGRHRTIYPDITYVDTIRMRTRTLDSLLAELPLAGRIIDFLVMDVQGAELMVLKGAEKSLGNVEFILAEASETALYEGACTLADLSGHLADREFLLSDFVSSGAGYGDAFFIRG